MSKFSVPVILAALALCACSRGKPSGFATLVIGSPNSSHLRDAIPAGRKACYGVNITGGGISTGSANGCSPPAGIIAGYVEPGQELQASVPLNQTINIDLYLFLEPEGQSVPCPTMSAAFPAAQLPNTYIIGNASNISTSSPTVTVSITAEFPAGNKNITQQLAMPATCQMASSPTLPVTPYSVSGGGERTLSGGNFTMRAHVGSVYQRPVLSAPGYTLYVR